MIGEKISPILVEIENAIWDHQANDNSKPNYTDEAFRAALKIFIDVMLDKMFTLQMNEKFTNQQSMEMAQSCGEEIRKLVKTYTNVDTHSLYKQ